MGGAWALAAVLALSGAMTLRPVTVEVTPHVAFAPAFVRVIVRLRPNPDNRGLYVEADSETYGRSSFIQVDGADAPITYWIDWPALDAGEYFIRAICVGSTGRVLARDQTQLRILGRE